jgi:hypothetical protein
MALDCAQLTQKTRTQVCVCVSVSVWECVCVCAHTHTHTLTQIIHTHKNHITWHNERAPKPYTLDPKPAHRNA